MDENRKGWAIVCYQSRKWLFRCRSRFLSFFFVVAKAFPSPGSIGTSPHTNPNGVQTIAEDTLFTNVAVDPKTNDVWWEGLSSPPEELIDWKGTDNTSNFLFPNLFLMESKKKKITIGNTWKNGETKTPASHPNARFTAKISNCPNHHPAFDDPHGLQK